MDHALRCRITAFSFCALQFATATPAQEVNSPCEQFGMNAATFVARVGERTPHRFTSGPDGPIATIPAYRAAVERGFRGVETGSTLYLAAIDDEVSLHNGQQYLIYGAFNFGLSHEVVTPTRTVPLEDAGADLAFLTSQESLLATTGRIYGRVQRGSIYGEANRQALPGIKLHVRVGDFVTEAVSDAQGRFDVGGLPEGFFKIEAELPPELTTGFTGGGEVRAGGCVPTGIVAQWNGIIRGRVMGADQRPIRGPVHLLPADPRTEQAFPREGQVKLANDSGEFEFAALPPGDYVLGVNLGRPQSGPPYPPTYFPGTPNRAEARTIQLGEGTVQENVDLVMPPRLATGRLVLRPATAASGHVFACVASHGAYRQPSPGDPITVYVVEGVRYRLRLHIEESSGRHWESEVIEAVGRAGDQEIALPAVVRPARRHPEGAECFNEP
jgi:hypothetical protein